MAELKDKVVTLESLKALHENNKRKYMPMVDPVGSGKMTMDGDISVSGSITLGDTVRLMPTTDGFDIIFLDTDITEEEPTEEPEKPEEETNSIELKTIDDYILKDSDDVYLTAEEGE